MVQLEERRNYTHHSFTPDQISETISIFLAQGGSIQATKKVLREQWGYAPTEPTIRKWLQSSNEALAILDQRTAANLQQDIGDIIAKAHTLLVQELDSGNFPVGKLGTLYGIMIDKFIMLEKLRSSYNSPKSDIIADDLYSEKTEIFNALLKSGKLPEDD